MAMNMDALLRITARVDGANAVQAFSRDLKGLDGAAKLSAKDLGVMQFAINKMAREAGNTTTGLRQHLSALQTLRDRVEIGGKAYNRLGVEIDQLRGKLRALDGDAKKTGAGLSQNLRGAAGSAAGVIATGGGLGSAVGAAGGALAASGGPAGMAAAAGLAATAGLTIQSVAAARALDEQTRRLRVMTDEGDILQQQVIALTRSQGYLTSTTEATAAAYDILQAGFSKNADIIQILKAATYGAVGGFTDVTTVADATTSILNGYGLAASNAAKIVDQMKVVTDDGKISMESYAQSIGRVIPSAAAAKLPLEEINAAISALTAQGVPVESTFSGLNQVIKTILKPTKEAQELAKLLGLEFNAQALAAKGLGGFLEEVGAKTGKSTDALSILFSDIDGYKAVVALLNDDLKRFNQFTENQAKAINKASEAAAKGVDPLKQYDNAWKDFSSTLGQLVLPALTGVTKAATGLLQALMQSGEQLGKMAEEGWIFNPVTGEFQVVEGGKPRARRPRAGEYVSRFAGARDKAFAAAQKIGEPPSTDPAAAARASLLAKQVTESGGGGTRRDDLQQLLRLSSAELAAAINTAIGEYNGPDPRGRTDVFANILARSRSGNYPRNLVDVVTQSGQYSPNQGLSRSQVINPNRYGRQRFEQVKAELLNPSLLSRSIQDVDSRLFFKGVSQYRNMIRGVDFLRAPGQNFFHGPSGKEGRNPQITAGLLREISGAEGVTGYLDQQAAAAEKTRASQAQLKNARETFELDTRILEARMQENQQLTLARTAQKELAGIRQQAADILSNKELPAAAQKAELDKLAVQAASVSRQLYFDISELESKRAATAQQAINKLIDEQELLYAKAAGVEEEVLLRQQLRDLTVGMTDAERARYAVILEQNKALKEQYGMSFGGGIRDGLKGYVESVGTAREATAQLTQTGVKGLEDALFSLVTTGTANFQEFAASILRDTARMILQLTIQKVIMQILGAINPAAGAGAGAGAGFDFGGPSGGFNLPGFQMPGYMQAGNAFGFAKGGAFGKNGIVPFAYGGIVNKPTLFQFAKGGTAATGLLGESGPEAILPLRRGPSGRLGVETSGAASSMNVTVNVDASGTKAEGDGGRAEQLGRVVSQAVQAELIKQKRPGGLLA